MDKKHSLMSAEQKLEVLKYANEFGVKEASLKYNCTERSIFRWKSRFNGSVESLENKNPAETFVHPNSHSEQEIKNIKEVMEKFPYLSYQKMYEILRTQYGYTRHPGSLYNYLRRHKMIEKPQLKIDYSTMFDDVAVSKINNRYLYNEQKSGDLYAIELNDLGIYLGKRLVTGNSAFLTRYFSMALLFDNLKDASKLVEKCNANHNFILTIKKIK